MVSSCSLRSLCRSWSSSRRRFTASSPSWLNSSRRRLRRSAGPSPNRQIGSPNSRRLFFTSASSVDTLISLARFRRSNSFRISACPPAALASSSSARYSLERWMFSLASSAPAAADELRPAASAREP